METVVKPSLSEAAYYVKIGLLNDEQLVLLCEEKLKNKEELNAADAIILYEHNLINEDQKNDICMKRLPIVEKTCNDIYHKNKEENDRRLEESDVILK